MGAYPHYNNYNYCKKIILVLLWALQFGKAYPQYNNLQDKLRSLTSCGQNVGTYPHIGIWKQTSEELVMITLDIKFHKSKRNYRKTKRLEKDPVQQGIC